MQEARQLGCRRKGKIERELCLCPMRQRWYQSWLLGRGGVKGGQTVLGPAPMRIARPAGAIVGECSFWEAFEGLVIWSAYQIE